MFEVDDDATKVEPIFIEMKKHLTTGYQRTILNRKAALNALLTGYDAMKS